MKKISIIIIGFAIIGICYGFARNNRFSHPLLKHHLKVLNAFDDELYAENCFKKIRLAIENKDKEQLRNLFTKNIQEKNKTLDEDIDFVFNFMDGPITDVSDIYGTRTSTSHYNGVSRSVIRGYYELYTQQQVYLLYFKICNKDNHDNKNIGLQMLQLIKKEDEEKYLPWGGEKIDYKGIFRPDKLQENIMMSQQP